VTADIAGFSSVKHFKTVVKKLHIIIVVYFNVHLILRAAINDTLQNSAVPLSAPLSAFD